MHKSAPWLALCVFLSACGMKGDLVLPEPPAAPEQPAPETGATVPTPAETDEPERRGVNPPSPDPDLVP
jgi:hypothetical protein